MKRFYEHLFVILSSAESSDCQIRLKYVSDDSIKIIFSFPFSGMYLKPETEDFSAKVHPNDLMENLTQGEIIYPEICMLELNLLSASKAKLDVLAHVFESFLKIIRQKEKNIFLLLQQVKEALDLISIYQIHAPIIHHLIYNL